VTSDWRTQYIWIQYILLLPWHLLAPLLPPFICLTKLHCVESRNDPSSFVRPLHRILCCALLFYMNTADKDKGKLFLCSWRHVRGGTALHQFLIVAPDIGEWSDILRYNHFSIRQRTLGTIECEVGFVLEPVWMFCRSEKFSELTKNLSLIV